MSAMSPRTLRAVLFFTRMRTPPCRSRTAWLSPAPCARRACPSSCTFSNMARTDWVWAAIRMIQPNGIRGPKIAACGFRNKVSAKALWPALEKNDGQRAWHQLGFGRDSESVKTTARHIEHFLNLKEDL